LEYHGLAPLAIELAQRAGRAVSQNDRATAIEAGFAAFARSCVAERVCASVTQPVLLLKGAELAGWYPTPGSRPSCDVDVLCADAHRAMSELHEAGFRAVGTVPAGHHHLPPIAAHGSPCTVDLHERLGLEPWMSHPRVEELFERAIPSRVVPGAFALHPADHAVYLAVHAFRTRPFATMRPLVDIAITLTETTRPDCAEVAISWGAGRVWNETLNAIDAYLFETRTPSAALRRNAGHLRCGDVAPGRRRVARYRGALRVTAPHKVLVAALTAARSNASERADRTHPGSAK
jgi:hypothetical protein